MDSATKNVIEKLEFLRLRIKNTSSVRFDAARRVRTDYKIAQLTVIILSLWAIFISYVLATDLASYIGVNKEIFTAVGVILPVLIVVFSLIEGGENYLRAHQLEYNARQLRELADQLYTSSAVTGLKADQLLNVFDSFSQKYSDCLERTSINHDDVDHYHRFYTKKLQDADFTQRVWWIYRIKMLFVWFETRYKRILYTSFWFIPVILFLM